MDSSYSRYQADRGYFLVLIAKWLALMELKIQIIGDRVQSIWEKCVFCRWTPGAGTVRME